MAHGEDDRAEFFDHQEPLTSLHRLKGMLSDTYEVGIVEHLIRRVKQRQSTEHNLRIKVIENQAELLLEQLKANPTPEEVEDIERRLKILREQMDHL
jgi:hypothetical protein